MTPLHWAASNGHESTVSLLVTLQANIEAKDDVSDNYDVCVFSVTVYVSVSLSIPIGWKDSSGLGSFKRTFCCAGFAGETQIERVSQSQDLPSQDLLLAVYTNFFFFNLPYIAR